MNTFFLPYLTYLIYLAKSQWTYFFLPLFVRVVWRSVKPSSKALNRTQPFSRELEDIFQVAPPKLLRRAYFTEQNVSICRTWFSIRPKKWSANHKIEAHFSEPCDRPPVTSRWFTFSFRAGISLKLPTVTILCIHADFLSHPFYHMN